MNRIAVLLASFIFIFTNTTLAQPWHYDFGDSTKSLTVSTESWSFLPLAPSGISKIRIGSGNGAIYLDSQVIAFGHSSYLRIKAPNAGSFTKFSLYDYAPSKSFTLKFLMRLGSSVGTNTAGSGQFSLYMGNGASFSGNGSITGSETFAAMRMTFAPSGNITTQTRIGSSWSNSGFTSTPFYQGTDYIVEIYGNNTPAKINYTHDAPQDVAPGKWDIWINGSLIGNEMAKSEMAGNVNIDSWVFYGESSTGNVAYIFLDDIYYTNTISEFPLPVNLSSFNVNASGRNVLLNWITSSEVNNSGFYVERCKKELNTDIKWECISFVPGNGTTGEMKAYTYSDNGLKSGTYLYRLRQVDFNGNYEYFEPQNNAAAVIGTPAFFDIKQNYPNPSNPVSKIDFEMPFDGNVSLVVYDISGKEVAVLAEGWRTADFYSVTFDGSNLASGVYFYRINAENGKESFAKTLKMILIK